MVGEGIVSYRELLEPVITTLLKDCSSQLTVASISTLLQCTYSALTEAAKSSNRMIDLAKLLKSKKVKVPAQIAIKAKEAKIAQNPS